MTASMHTVPPPFTDWSQCSRPSRGRCAARVVIHTIPPKTPYDKLALAPLVACRVLVSGRMLEIIRKHLGALSASNWVNFRSVTSRDVVYEDISMGTRISGIEPYVASAQRWKAAFPDLRTTLTRGYTAGDRVIAEVLWEGTQTGPLENAYGLLPPSNRRSKLHSAIFFSIKFEKISECRHYFDLATLWRQLGIDVARRATPASTVATL